MKQIKCPYCGYVMPVWQAETSLCEGLFIRCKGRKCKKIFEIKIKQTK